MVDDDWQAQFVLDSSTKLPWFHTGRVILDPYSAVISVFLIDDFWDGYGIKIAIGDQSPDSRDSTVKALKTTLESGRDHFQDC